MPIPQTSKASPKSPRHRREVEIDIATPSPSEISSGIRVLARILVAEALKELLPANTTATVGDGNLLT